MRIINQIKQVLIILIMLFSSGHLYSQVTIGSNIEPKQGSLLDLKQNDSIGANSKKGLLLPRVSLRSQSDLYPIVSNATEDDKKLYTGLLVFNVTGNVYHCPGLRIWNANRWVALASDTDLAALSAPNSYILIPGQSVSIPVLKAYAAWYKYAQECRGEYLSGIVSAQVYWQDKDGLITNSQSSEFSLPISGSGKNAEIQVQAGDVNKKGNAVIAVRVGPNGNNSDSIRWSWHVWVTDAPTNTTYSYDNNNDGVADVTFMDRNLGATSVAPADGYNTFGLLYQWGRKDPFPPSAAIASIAEPVLYGSKTSITKQLVSEANNLLTTIVNPLNYYYGNTANAQDWYSASNIHNDELWINFDNQKSPFDPCPQGWRVPAYVNNLSPWNDFTTTNFVAATISSTLARGRERGADFYPNGGFRSQLATGALQNVGTNAYYWTATPSNTGALGMYIGNTATGVNSVTPNSFNSRARGSSVRCVKE